MCREAGVRVATNVMVRDVDDTDRMVGVFKCGGRTVNLQGTRRQDWLQERQTVDGVALRAARRADVPKNSTATMEEHNLWSLLGRWAASGPWSFLLAFAATNACASSLVCRRAVLVSVVMSLSVYEIIGDEMCAWYCCG